MKGDPRDRLTMFTIYERPRDYPAGYVIRVGFVSGDGYYLQPEPYAVDLPTLATARAALPDLGLYRVPRDASDDPVIVEVWL